MANVTELKTKQLTSQPFRLITIQNAINNIYLHKRYDPAYILSDDF